MPIKQVIYQRLSYDNHSYFDGCEEWTLMDTLYCPFCGQTICVWKNTGMEHWEDNIGDCHLCTKCKASFHVSDYSNYINEINTESIIKGLKNDQR